MYDPRQVCVSCLILLQQGNKDVGKLPVHAYYLLLLLATTDLQKRTNWTIARQTDNTAFIPDSVTWGTGRLKGPKPVTYTMICWGAPLVTGAWQTERQGSLVVGFGDGWWDCRVQAFKKPMHVTTDKSLWIPGTLSFSLPPCKHTHTHTWTDIQTDAPRVNKLQNYKITAKWSVIGGVWIVNGIKTSVLLNAELRFSLSL